MQKQISYKVIDLFSGAGGFGLGFKMADYNLHLSLEKDAWASDTLLANNPDNTIILNDDIRHYKTNNDILSICKIKPDVIIGGPPCQGFSNAGCFKSDPDDPRNYLFKHFVKWVECLRPTMFVMENVKGILTKTNSNGDKVIDVIKKSFNKIGYSSLNIWTLNAAEYGVPQLRERVFIVGHKDNINIPAPPKTHYIKNKCFDLVKAISVIDAISDLPKINAKEGEEEQKYDKKPKTKYQRWVRGEQDILYNHVAMKHTNRIVDRFRRIKIGESVTNVSKKYRERKRNGEGMVSMQSYNMNNRRLNPYKPAFTIPASFYSSFIHPYQHRNFTAREAARLQSFPDDYRFMGKRTLVSSLLLKRTGMPFHNCLSQYNQIGNAVPPLLSKAIAKHIKLYLK